MVSIIYCITNIANDKQYVGQAVNKDKRWRDHKIMLNAGKHKNKHLQNAYNKYGKENFIYTVLEIVSPGWHLQEQLTEREQYWMDVLDCVTPKGYNLNPTAASATGFKHSLETKLKWSKQRKGQKRSAEFALNVSIRMTGKIITEDTRQRLVDSHTGKTQTLYTRDKRAVSMMGNKNNSGKKRATPTSAETRKKISEAKKAGYAKRKATLDKA